jgi:predicted thioredoxin/glutaredoxin
MYGLVVRLLQVLSIRNCTVSKEKPYSSVEQAFLKIYVSCHCSTCAYAYMVAEAIRRDFPTVDVSLIDIHETQEAIPEAVFATPTYLLNGRVWSLGNPSPEKINETLQNFV